MFSLFLYIHSIKFIICEALFQNVSVELVCLLQVIQVLHFCLRSYHIQVFSPEEDCLVFLQLLQCHLHSGLVIVKYIPNSLYLVKESVKMFRRTLQGNGVRNRKGINRTLQDGEWFGEIYIHYVENP